jgi:K+-sensing histidine kinase KdpD
LEPGISENPLADPALRLFSVSVVVALGVSFAFQHYQFRDVELPILTVSIALTTWYAGAGPSLLAVLLSAACFDYFFTEPLYSLNIATRDLPYFLIFVAWAAIVASFSAVRRRIEDNLRQTRDSLQIEVEQRRHREDEIRKLNLDLGKRAAELEAANHELESFAYSVSHDLRAPLRHVVGYSELLQKQASSLLDEKSRRFIQTILNSAKRMGNLIDDLLAFSRIGRAETNKTKVDLNQLVNEVVAEVGQDTKGRHIALEDRRVTGLLRRPFHAETGRRQPCLERGQIQSHARGGRNRDWL